MYRPTLLDVLAARRRIAPYVWRTPLHRHLALDRLLEAEVYVKHENHQKLGAFKVRGGINLMAQLVATEKLRGVTTASSGNHGQSIAYAAGVFGVPALVVVPENANPGKVEAIRNLGAEVHFYGPHFDVARQHAEKLAQEKGYRYIHAVNEPLLIAGVATYSLEILEDLPDAEVLIVPIGGGSGACGACIVGKSLNPRLQVIGVQAEKAPAAYLSWKAGRIVEAPMETEAEGLATATGYELTQGILRDLLDDFVLVSEAEMQQAIVLHLEKTHNLTEHAGAASLAAALKLRDRLRGKKVVLVMSGGNVSLQHLRAALAAAS
ncbi:MAG: threonine ammonia-lyase [Candidatus Tectimicrobiota bacterium]|nr:MAG: threonine ammonia-lyase [Candidatus Tectomicrobia bacterium]